MGGGGPTTTLSDIGSHDGLLSAAGLPATRVVTLATAYLRGALAMGRGRPPQEEQGAPTTGTTSAMDWGWRQGDH
jgi:hypothetical protein